MKATKPFLVSVAVLAICRPAFAETALDQLLSKGTGAGSASVKVYNCSEDDLSVSMDGTYKCTTAERKYCTFQASPGSHTFDLAYPGKHMPAAGKFNPGDASVLLVDRDDAQWKQGDCRAKD